MHPLCLLTMILHLLGCISCAQSNAVQWQMTVTVTQWLTQTQQVQDQRQPQRGSACANKPFSHPFSLVLFPARAIPSHSNNQVKGEFAVLGQAGRDFPEFRASLAVISWHLISWHLSEIRCHRPCSLLWPLKPSMVWRVQHGVTGQQRHCETAAACSLCWSLAQGVGGGGGWRPAVRVSVPETFHTRNELVYDPSSQIQDHPGLF